MIAPKDPVAATVTRPQPSSSAWSPFRHATFAVLWIATVVSIIGTAQRASTGVHNCGGTSWTLNA
jgi:hypothetical protein